MGYNPKHGRTTKRLNIKWDPSFTLKLKSTVILYDVNVTEFFRIMSENLMNGNKHIIDLVKSYSDEKAANRKATYEAKRAAYFANRPHRTRSKKTIKIDDERVKIDIDELTKDDIFKLIEEKR